MKKIYFITYQFKTGGVEKLFLTLSDHLVDFEVFLIPLNANFDHLIQDIPSRIQVVNLSDRNKILRVFTRQKNFISVCCAFVMKILMLLFDRTIRNSIIINFSDTFSTLLVTYILSWRNKSLSWVHLNPLEFKKSFFFRGYKSLFQRMSAIVCICHDQKKIFHQVFRNVPEKKSVVIYNSIDPVRIDGLKSEPVNIDKPFMLSVARLDSRSKDFRTLIEAFGQFKHNMPYSGKLVIIGDGDDKEGLLHFTKELGLENSVIFQGIEANPYRWMAKADAFVLSSKFEGFGLVLVEAMQSGTLVISTNCKIGPDEILAHGHAGILVEVGNIDQMEKAMCEGITNIYLRNGKLEAANEQVKKFYVQNSVRDFRKLIKMLS